MQSGTFLPRRGRWLLLLLGYLTLLLVLTLMPPRFEVQQRLRLVPLETIIAQTRTGGWPFLINIVGNIAVLVPLGILVPAWAPRLCSIASILAVGLLTSATIELLQLGFTVRVADIDDVVLNVAGALLGYALYRLLSTGSGRYSRQSGEPAVTKP